MRRSLLAVSLVLLATTTGVAAEEAPASVTVQWGVDAFAELQTASDADRQEMANVLAFLFISVRDSWNFLVANNESCPIIETNEVIDSYSNILTAVGSAPELVANGALDHDLVPILMIDIQGRLAELGFDCRLS